MMTARYDLISRRKWIDVVFPHARLPKLSYHYEFEDQELPIGSRVLAPVGSRTLTGFVISSLKQVDIETKSILHVVDDAPVMTKELVVLLQQCAALYAVPHGDILQTMLLKGLSYAAKKKIVPSGQMGKPLNDLEQAFFEHLQKSKYWDYQHFNKHRKADVALLRSVQKKGWIDITALPGGQTAKVKEDIYYRFQLMPSKRVGPVQKDILEHLQKVNDWVPAVALQAKFGKSTTSLKALLKKKCIASKTQIRNTTSSGLHGVAQNIKPTADQKEVLARIVSFIEENKAEEIMLHGVTGSGKTEVYLQATHACLQRGKKVLALVPEISLTPQFVQRFMDRFGDQVALLHSQRTDSQRLTEWYRVLQGEAKIVVGTRSAIFSPLDNIGLIIIDEFHDGSYKQHDGFRYHAMDVAQMRSRYHQCPIVLGSATPNVDMYHQVKHKVELKHRVTGHALPEVEICDLKNEKDFGKKYWIGEKLRLEIEKTLSRQKQVLLFLNRRGYSHVVYCYRCGKEVHCPHCDVTLTFHKAKNTAQCHYCYYEHDLDDHCPSCHEGKLVHFGMGTEKIEEELKFKFPDASIARLDRDQTQKKNIFSDTMNQMMQGKIDILLGTQMITKGLDLPNIELVGIVLADQSLYFPDYLAAETTFQLITQVVGRSGRGKNKGKALIQTLQPQHYAIVHGAKQDYHGFYTHEIEHRRAMMFPPFSYLVLFEAVGQKIKDVEDMMGWLATQVSSQGIEINILGPAPAPIAKLRDDYRFHLLLRHADKNKLYALVQWLYQHAREHFEKRKIKLTMDINPVHFL
ncbi:MAG: primosomal protein N' [Deltaproteobacteria bacterium]|nr:primosomal protein N' [Deltaproteobacteria bacterium]